MEFIARKSADGKRFIICLKNYENFPMDTKEGGSYGLAPARVLGVKPHEYFLYLMQKYPNDVEVVGKGKKYLVAYWKAGSGLQSFLKLLNSKTMKGRAVANNKKGE